MKRIKLWIKFLLLAVYGLVIIGISLFIYLYAAAVLSDEKAIESSRYVNQLSLLFGVISLPGVVVGLLNITESFKKKEMVATTKCPNCKHSVDIFITER